MGQFGQAWTRPLFEDAAPALLGFDETIDHYCGERPKRNRWAYTAADAQPHARECYAASLNILSLYGDRVPYNSASMGVQPAPVP